MALLSRALLLLPLATALLLPGCIENGEFGIGAQADTRADVSTKFQDADQRISSNGHYGGTHDTQTVHVPIGSTSFRVAAAYSFDGAAHVALTDPNGRTVKQISVSGDHAEHDSHWYQTSRPTAGDWTLSISASGSSSYSFGFYY